ncbi:MAG: LacI family DNA-binding transcriptional regulator [Solirubrobacterales bacterium]
MAQRDLADRGATASASGAKSTVRRKRATVKMVADAAGVSPTTVSRVLNGKSDTLLEETRQRVFEAARQLSYRPNSVAVSLRKQMTLTIGLIVPDIANAYFHQLARGAEDVAVELGYTVVLCNTDRKPEKESMALELLGDKQVDGIIFTGGGVDGDAHVSERLEEDAKVVTIGPHRLPYPSIGVDDRAAVETAVLHLAEQGCKSIACIGGQPGWLIHQERMNGFEDGLRLANLKLDPELVWLSDMSVEAGWSTVRSALDRGLAFDGVIAFSDYAALSAIQALLERGVRVPEDVAVVGCDDTVFSTLVEPRLSSIAFSAYEFGAQATRMLVAMNEGKEVGRRVEFPFELHVRESSRRMPVEG